VVAALLASELGAQAALDTLRSPSGRYAYVDHHINPSAGRLVVLTRNLKPVAELEGWSLGVLANDVVLYQRNQVHFNAPAYPVEIRTFDPGTRRDVRLWTSNGVTARLVDSVSIDRSRGTASFRVEIGEATVVDVVCRDVETRRPRCVQTKRAEGLVVIPSGAPQARRRGIAAVPVERPGCLL
jgi:hypothetical protein